MSVSRLCSVCNEVNFKAILTPREWDEDANRMRTIYRPELIGNGKSPSISWGRDKKGLKPGVQRLKLPQIRTAYYEDLSDSDEESDIVDHEAEDEPDGQTTRDSIAGEVFGSNNGLGVELDDLDTDDEGNDGQESNDSTSTWSGTSHFTELTRIDLDKQAEGNWSYLPNLLYFLGSIWDVRKRRHRCDLCRKLWNETKKNPDIKNRFMTKSRCILKLVELRGRRRDPPEKYVSMLRLVYIYAYKFDNPRAWDWITHPCLIFQGIHHDTTNVRANNAQNAMYPFRDDLYGEARQKGLRCDFELFKKWLKMCETAHGHSIPEYGGEMSIRFVDVQRSCLVDWTGPASAAPRYVTLSYVWGKTRKTILTKSRLRRFKTPGSLDRNLDRTVRDAFSVVRGMGERYIWVDALCIIQDSKEDQAVQLKQMHMIYGFAVLTIVSAYGRDCNAGLPGIGSHRVRDSFSLDLDGITILTSLRRGFCSVHNGITLFENYLRRSVYSERAWTFQESRLSTRALVFTRHLAYWECSQCTWCEETCWESAAINFIHLRGIKNPTPEDIWKDNFDRQAYEADFDDRAYKAPQSDCDEQEKDLSNSYASLVRSYSIRKLTYQRDILDAVSGVLTSIKQRDNTDFLFALRTKHFGNDLLFNILAPPRARFNSEDGVGHNFPSWSWLSWNGQIDIANQTRGNSWDPVTDLVECDGVKCYTLDTNQENETVLRLINEQGGWRFQSGYERLGEGIWDDTLDLDGDGDDSVLRLSGIEEFPQDITLSDVRSHPAFDQMIPGFHIFFRTFSTTVLLKTNTVKGTAGFGDRHVYTRAPTSDISTSSLQEQDEQSVSELDTTDSIEFAYRNDIATLRNPRTSEWSAAEFNNSFPDGMYKLVWMNNNQIPNWGCLLCRPVSSVPYSSGKWEGEVLRRVSGFPGPTQMMHRNRQEKFGAEWGLIVLG